MITRIVLLGALLSIGAVPARATPQRSRAASAPTRSIATPPTYQPGSPTAQTLFDFRILPISARDHFGSSLGVLGDLDGDGFPDLVAGAPDENTGPHIGTAWVLFLDDAGTVARWQHLDPPRPLEPGAPLVSDHFGAALANLGDLDGDGRPELAVGAPATETDARFGVGKVWILSLEPDGSVYAQHAITEGEAGFTEDLEYTDSFGGALEAIGDLDGDGVGDLAVGARSDTVGGVRTGSVRILFLYPDGTVKAVTTIAAGLGGFTGALDALDRFGASLASLGDIDGDGNVDIAVGASGDDDTLSGQIDKGAAWVLFLNPDGTVRTQQKLSETQGSLGAVLDGGAEFGTSAEVFDLEGDGTPELLVGVAHDADANPDTGAFWMVSLAADGTALARREYSHRHGGVVGLHASDRFGAALAAPGDLDGDGIQDLFVGASQRELTLCTQPGVVFRLDFDAAGTVTEQAETGGRCMADENFATSAVEIGDINGDGHGEFAIGAPATSNQNLQVGSVWMFSNEGATGYTPVLNLLPDTTNVTPTNFGLSLAAPGDLDGDGIPDLAVGALGRIYTLRFNADRSIKAQRTFTFTYSTSRLAHCLTALGDLDGNGVNDLAAGAPLTSFYTSGRNEAGALVVIFLNPDGTKLADTLITEFHGGFTGFLPGYGRFGSSVAWLGDLDGDGFGELAVGAPGDALRTPLASGSVWILSLSPTGTVVRELELTYGLAGLVGPMDLGILFGSGLLNVGDLDHDGLPELLVASAGDDEGGPDHGALWILFLHPDGTVRTVKKLSEGSGLRGDLQGGADLGGGMGLLPAFSGPDQVTLFVGAPLDDRFGRAAGAGWLLSLFRR